MYKSGDTVTLAELTQLESSVKLAKGTKEVKREILEPNKIVYIDPSSNMSREKFKKCYPTNKITYTLSKAEVIITTQYYRYGNIFGYSFIQEMFRDNSDPKIPRWQRKGLLSVIINDKQAVELNKGMKKVEMYLSSAPLIHDMSLEMKGSIQRVIEPEELSKITMMMSSNDREMVKLGLIMLTGFNFEDNTDAYLLCFAKMKHTYILNSRLYKDLRHKVMMKYPNIRL